MIYKEYPDKHQGQIAHERIKESGYTFKYVAKELNKTMKMSRNTLYIRLKHRRLTPKFLVNLGQVINHDFTIDFPNLQHNEEYLREEESIETTEKRNNRELVNLQVKYYKTLEESNKLLKFLVRTVNENKLYSLKRRIDSFIDENIKKN